MALLVVKSVEELVLFQLPEVAWLVQKGHVRVRVRINLHCEIRHVVDPFLLRRFEAPRCIQSFQSLAGSCIWLVEGETWLSDAVLIREVVFTLLGPAL